MISPFLYISLAFILGIFGASLIPLPPLLLLPILAVSPLLAWIIFLKKKEIPALVLSLITIFLAGAALYQDHNTGYEKNALHRFNPDIYADFTGILFRTPSRGLDKDTLYLKVENIILGTNKKQIKGNLKISLFHTPELVHIRNLLTGDRIKVSAQISTFPGFRNFDSAPFEWLLKTQNLHNRAHSKSPLLVQKIRPGSLFSPLRGISLIRRDLQEKIQALFPGSNTHSISEKGAVLEALLLGERGRIPETTIQALQKSGLFHLFAISGAHIGIISFILFSLFKILKIPTRISYILLMFFLSFYAFLVEGRPSVLRATIMALAYLFGKTFWKDISLINTLFMSAFLLLLLDPFQLFSLGFQLTYAAMLSIILFFPRILKLIPCLPFKISEMLVLSFTAQMGVLPFIALAFNRVTFSSILLNCAAIPFLGIIMTMGFILLPIAFISLGIAQFLASILGFLIDQLIHLSTVMDGIKFMSFRVPTPYLWVVAGYFFFLLVLLLPIRSKKVRLTTVMGALVLLSVIIIHPFPVRTEHLCMTVLDVGQGESILIEFPGQKKMLIDGGGFPGSRFDVGEKIVSRFLWNKGIKAIDYLVLTHGHPDHLKGLISVAKNFHIMEYWEAFYPAQNTYYEKFKENLPLNIQHKRIFRGRDTHISGVKIQALYPLRGNPEVFSVNNDQSLVLRLEYGKIAILLTGDIEEKAESDLVENPHELNSQILKSPHHGSKTSSSFSFLRAVSPDIVVISVGHNNMYGHPDKKILNRYNKIGATVYRTDKSGAIEISTDGEQLFIRTAVSQKCLHSQNRDEG